jgi:hypothetical protein
VIDHNYNMQLMQNSANPPRCECHECTQARWKMYGGQLAGGLTGGFGSQAAQGGLEYQKAQLADFAQ